MPSAAHSGRTSFRVSLEKAVFVLDADEAGGAVGHGVVGLAQLFGREVGASDLADLAGGDAFVEGPQGVGDGCVAVGGVEDVEVDPVGVEATEAVLQGRADIGRLGPVTVVVHLHPELGGQDDLLPAGTESLAQELLALGTPVDVGRVEEGDAVVEGGVDHLGAAGGVDPAPEVVATEADDRHLERPDGTCPHHDLLGPADGSGGSGGVKTVSSFQSRTLIDWLAVASRVPSSAQRWAKP